LPISPEAARVRARIAGKKRQNPRADVTEDQRELKTVSLEEHIRRVVDGLPPLSEEQRTRLALLLSPAAKGGDANAA
jgi:hypothetical protein